MNSYSTIVTGGKSGGASSRSIFWLGVCLAFGVAFIVFQNAWLIAFVSLGTLFLLNLAIRRRMQIWQALMLIGMTGFIILNYGFENFTAGQVAGVPLLTGEMLMFGGLALALHDQGRDAAACFGDPAIKCIVVLWILTCFHLLFDFPKFGLYAFRDASVFLEAVFLLAGFLWTHESGSIRMLNRWLLFLFIANLIYSSTLPFGEILQEHSPASGLFRPVALLGQYQDNSLYIVAGAFFCVWIARYVVAWKRWLLIVLATAQLAELVILQTRSMYIGIVLVAILLVLIGERRKFTQLIPIIGGGIALIALFLVMVSALGITVQGRVTDLRGSSLREHALSLFSLSSEQNRLGQDEDRLDWINQVWTNTVADTQTAIFGQGFGKPLIDFEQNGVPVRQPHNAILAVFGRLGVLGVSVWLLFHLLVLTRFVKFIRKTRGCQNEAYDFVVWLLAFYVLASVMSMVQPTLEFSHGAIPFYFLIGVGLALTSNRQLGQLHFPSSDAVEANHSLCDRLFVPHT